MQNERKRTVTLIPDKINPDSFKLNGELTHSIWFAPPMTNSISWIDTKQIQMKLVNNNNSI